MIPREKALEIVIKMQFQKEPLMFEQAKQCALIVVDELIYSHSQDTTDNQYYFWQEVKQEIEKL